MLGDTFQSKKKEEKRTFNLFSILQFPPLGILPFFIKDRLTMLGNSMNAIILCRCRLMAIFSIRWMMKVVHIPVYFSKSKILHGLFAYGIKRKPRKEEMLIKRSLFSSERKQDNFVLLRIHKHWTTIFFFLFRDWRFTFV